MDMVSKVMTNEAIKEIKKEFKQLKYSEIFEIESTSTTYIVRLKKSKHKTEVFKALKGSAKVKGTWLVRHFKNLFEDQRV